MIHKACMPVYMNTGKIGAGRVDGKSKVLQEVLADLKSGKHAEISNQVSNQRYFISIEKSRQNLLEI